MVTFWISTSLSPLHKRALQNDGAAAIAIIEASEILQLSQGKAIIWNRGIGDRHGFRIPLIQTIRVPDNDLKASKESTADWETPKQQFLGTALPHFTQQDFVNGRSYHSAIIVNISCTLKLIALE